MIANKRFKPFLAGISAMLLVLFLLNAQLFIGQIIAWISPGNLGPAVMVPETTIKDLGKDRVIIPRINVEAPLITDMREIDEPRVQTALQNGVVNFGPTALPGQGNTVVVGHSSNNVWAPGDYKFVFALLDRVKPGDKIYVIYKNQRYEYQIDGSRVVNPRDITVLQPTDISQITLITCTPVGTSLNRLVVTAKQTSPTSPTNLTKTNPQHVTILPGN